MTLLIIIVIILILLCIVRISNNNDLIKENSKDKKNDLENVKNARKYFSNKKTFKCLLIASIISIIIIIICDFTSIDAAIIDYFSTDIYQEKELNKVLYLVPIYIFVIREIIIEVKIGDFLFKYYKVEEPVLEENLLKTILYKKPTNNQVQTKKESK